MSAPYADNQSFPIDCSTHTASDPQPIGLPRAAASGLFALTLIMSMIAIAF
jgi:hypothetical protein